MLHVSHEENDSCTLCPQLTFFAVSQTPPTFRSFANFEIIRNVIIQYTKFLPHFIDNYSSLKFAKMAPKYPGRS